MTDPITDMLNRIRNSQAVFKEAVSLPFSDLKYRIAKILEKQGLIEKLEKKGRKSKKIIFITLKYQDKAPIIRGLKRKSKPGQRMYISSGNIKPVQGGYGLSVISTSKGLMTDKEARKKGLGGEIICEVW